jgi:hypothetical protein
MPGPRQAKIGNFTGDPYQGKRCFQQILDLVVDFRNRIDKPMFVHNIPNIPID